MTSQPSNDSELQLYRVLQRANLLAYYDTFICQGGDDVQQLCEAGEEEFLEIMALVGMASKPLHVRRLQKALQEWMSNPVHPFAGTVPPPSGVGGTSTPVAITPPAVNATILTQPTYSGNLSTPSPSHFPNSATLSEYSQPCSPFSMNPVLLDKQIKRLADSADKLIKNLPPIDMKPLLNPNKKRISKEIEAILAMQEDDPRRMEEIRKYAAIYGRFDCKRKPEKPLTLHEVSVNEAAAQLCHKLPALLGKRDELFPLARQVVRSSGYQYSKGHSRSQSTCKLLDLADSDDKATRGNKRMRLEGKKNNIGDEERKRRYQRLEGIVDQLKSLASKQEEIKTQIQEANAKQNLQAVSQLQSELELILGHHIQLEHEKVELENQQKQFEKSSKSEGSDKAETEDTDSQFSMYSNDSNLRDSHNSSPSRENASTPEAMPKASGKKKESMAPSCTNPNNNNSNDSGEFVPKPLLNEVLEEGLRMAKDFGSTFEETLDMRFINKCSEVLRMPNCFSNTLESNTVARPVKNQDHPRPRGRPPKATAERNLFLEQFFSQAQIQQQLLTDYQNNLQANLINELNNNNNAKARASSNFADGTEANEKDVFDDNGSKKNLRQLEDKLNIGKSELNPSLSALITMSNNNNNNPNLVNDGGDNNLEMSSL